MLRRDWSASWIVFSIIALPHLHQRLLPGRSISLLNTGGSLNREKAGLEPQGGYHSPTNVVSASSATEPLCRPWDRGDLFRRLATFKSMTWFGKPQVVGPVACARKGWVNVDIDMVSCYGCGAHQSFPIPASWTKQQVESAAEDFAKRLETGHKSLCPWKGNECAEGLAQFPPTPLDVLVQGYNDRCEALLKLSALPLITGSAINHMKLSKGPQVDRLLACSQRVGTGNLSCNWDKEPGAECIKELQAADNAYHQARKLIGLCGWELRLLPYSVDSDDTHENVCLANPTQSREAVGPKVSVCLKGGFNQQAVTFLAESQFTWDPSAALLECKFCGANVGLWNFTKMARPSPAICPIAEEQPEVSPKDSETPLCQTHASSGSDAWSGGEPNEIVKDVPEVMKSPEHSPCPKGVLDLSLTIAGGPPPTQLNYPASVTATFISVPGFQPMSRQLESSQMGDWVVSQKSREPQEDGHDIGAGESSVSRQNSRLPQTDSVNGIVVDNDGDETDIGISQRATTDFQKRKLAEDTSAVDQISPDIAVEEERYAITGFHKSLDIHVKKRKRQESVHKESNVQLALFKDTPVSSSVNAVNTTCYCKMANSAESVEYLPEGSDGHETGVSGKNEQLARFGADVQANNRQSEEVVEPGSSRSDEGDGEGLGTNVVGVNSNTKTRNICMTGASDGIARNHEAAMEGEVNRTEISYNFLPSTAAETEHVADMVNPQVRRNESVNDRGLTGESVPRMIKKLVVDTHGDSNEVFVSLSLGHGEASVKAKVSQRECEEHRVQAQKIEHRMQDDTNDTIVGLLISGETGTVEHADAEGPQNSKSLHSLTGKYFAGASEAVNSIEDKCLAWNKEDGSFDPVLQHHHFCPWVNTNATDISLCGWQLTLDALNALRIKEHIPGGMTESESTASKYKGNPLVSVRSLFRGSSLSINNASC
ncbi:hypothetical protein O6H91_Y317500 [Diphasiastrum complanatum]|nr:hypothetical protein O6H91_Y317500 [Diphasiastrum complanatum]